MIYGNIIGGTGIDQIFIIEDDAGNEFPAVFVNDGVALTATANDIRKGSIAVTEAGVIEGTKEIPPYYTIEGRRAVTNGSKFILPVKYYEYTRLQAIICPFNTNMDDSVAAEKVVISDRVYSVQSTESEYDVVKDTDNARVDFGYTNESGRTYLIRYFLYKEIY